MANEWQYNIIWGTYTAFIHYVTFCLDNGIQIVKHNPYWLDSSFKLQVKELEMLGK